MMITIIIIMITTVIILITTVIMIRIMIKRKKIARYNSQPIVAVASADG